MIVVLGSFHLCVNGSDVDLLLVDHDHHLPLALVFAHATEFGTPEGILAHVVMRSLWLFADQHCVRRAFADSTHDLILHLLELFGQHVLFDLCFQAEEGRRAFVLMLSALREPLVERSAEITLPLMGILGLLTHDALDEKLLVVFLGLGS